LKFDGVNSFTIFPCVLYTTIDVSFSFSLDIYTMPLDGFGAISIWRLSSSRTFQVPLMHGIFDSLSKNVFTSDAKLIID
jgi:hypothetical protein